MKFDINDAGTRYVLLEPLAYDRWCVTVPAGFVTDLASTPKAIWSIYPPMGHWQHAAVLHDWIYTYHKSLPLALDNRQVADHILREQMRLDGVGWRTRWTFWVFVRIFGGSHWRKA